MKKLLALTLSIVLVMAAFTACGKKEDTKTVDTTTETTDTTNETEPTEAAEPTETVETATGAKTGLAVINSVAKSKDAAEGDGLAQANATVVAVIVDEAGVITDLVIDVVQSKINFSATGEITTDLATEFATKTELGDAYGMKKASGISKEWFEQAQALTDYVIGKTLDEVKGIAVDESGKATSEDLTSSVTVGITDYLSAIEKAVNTAQVLGAAADNKLGVGIVSTTGKSKNAADDAEGLAQAYNTYGVVTLDAEGKITSSIIDASQANVKFGKDGKITTDLTAEISTKLELGDAYGMKNASGIGKEWFEQAQAFTAYIAGKTGAEVTGIALDEEGTPTDADLVSSVTVGITDFLRVIDKAATTAK